MSFAGPARVLIAAAVAAAALASAAAPRPEEQALDVRFGWVDVWLDSGAEELAAWQVELVDPSGRARVVGVEGGDHAAFAKPPYYDPAALAGGRIVLAALDTGTALPSGRVRVARVHFAVRGAAAVRCAVELQAAAGPSGERIPCRATATEER